MITAEIRPLTAYKKANKTLYDNVVWMMETGAPGLSQKQKDNLFYWGYAYLELNTFDKSLSNREIDPFFWKDGNTKNNITIVSELGRLLMYGWYYDIEDFTLEFANYIISGYKKYNELEKESNKEKFVNIIKYIRVNIGYYHQHQDELKMYLLEELFQEKIEHLLPEKPKELASFDKVVKLLTDIREANLKKDKNYYYKLASDQESYFEYLQELLDSYGIGYLSYEEKMEEVAAENEIYWENLSKVESAYNKEKKMILSNNKNLLT